MWIDTVQLDFLLNQVMNNPFLEQYIPLPLPMNSDGKELCHIIILEKL